VTVEEYNGKTKYGYGVRRNVRAPRYIHVKDVGGGGGGGGTTTTTVPANHNPYGNVDSIVVDWQTGHLSVDGWAYDPDAGDGAISVNLMVDGTLLASRPAGDSRSDVGRHGFSFSQGVDYTKSHTISVVAVNTGQGTSTTLPGGKTLSPSAQTPSWSDLDEPTVGTRGQVVLHWSKPIREGTTPTLGYRVTVYSPISSETTTFASTATTQTISGLADGIEYGFTVTPYNSVGDGPESYQWKATPIALPLAPTDLKAAEAADAFIATWKPPSDTGDTPIKYNWVAAYVSGNWIFSHSDGRNNPGSMIVPKDADYTPIGSSLAFAVYAQNEQGEGPQSPRTPSIVVGDPTTAPTINSATAHNGSASLTWNPPATGSGSISGYVVTPYIAGVPQAARTFNSPGQSQEISGLTNGEAYTFRVAALRNGGATMQSAESDEITPSAPPAFTPFSSWDAFVAQQLMDFAGSPGTAASRAPIVSGLTSGGIDSDEFISNELNETWFGPHVAPVARLYWAYFGRIPDYSGMTYWAGKHRNGTSISKISQGFANSNEFKTKYGALSNRNFVLRIYTDVLGRTADTNGVNYWTKKLDGGTTRGQVMINFSESNEYKNKMAAKVNVVMLYAGMLHRAPTTGELTSGTGTALDTLANTIRLSTAYANRIG
jgi:hypothetical protein